MYFVTSASASLRTLTADNHRAAEQSLFQRRFIRGQLPVAAYIGWLSQMLCVYRSLEGHLNNSTLQSRPRLHGEPWRRSAELERDLTHFSRSPAAAAPNQATVGFLDQLDRWAQTEPAALLGVLYVLEGSTNGSRHIARVLRSVYGLTDVNGLRFMDPYGERQPQRWVEFKVALDAEVTADEVPTLVAAAQATFDAVTSIGAELAGDGPA